jgi:hypothetical protein
MEHGWLHWHAVRATCQRAEVLDGLGGSLAEQANNDAASLLASNGHVEVYLRAADHPELEAPLGGVAQRNDAEGAHAGSTGGTLLVTLGPFFASTARSAEAPTRSTSNAMLRDICDLYASSAAPLRIHSRSDTWNAAGRRARLERAATGIRRSHLVFLRG